MAPTAIKKSPRLSENRATALGKRGTEQVEDIAQHADRNRQGHGTHGLAVHAAHAQEERSRSEKAGIGTKAKQRDNQRRAHLEAQPDSLGEHAIPCEVGLDVRRIELDVNAAVHVRHAEHGGNARGPRTRYCGVRCRRVAG
jgi:hypothetical protein